MARTVLLASACFLIWFNLTAAQNEDNFVRNQVNKNHATKPEKRDIPEDPDHPELSLMPPTPQDYYIRAQQDGIRRTYGKEHWRRMAQQSLSESLAREKLNQNVAKNVIIFVGDGFGLGTSTLARIWEGNQLGMDGEEHYLSFEKFPYFALSKVYNSDWQVPDSAGSATAMFCGVKNPFNTLGVDDTVIQEMCPSQIGHEVDSILYWAQDAGKSTGVVTNTRLTHATPAAAYASSASRAWESDTDVWPWWRDQCPDIARQLVERGHKIKVAMGGARRVFMGSNTSDPVDTHLQGIRTDQRNLIEEWELDKEAKGGPHAAVFTKQQLEAVDGMETDYILGLFSYSSSLSMEESRPPHEPPLNLMVSKALDVLQRDDNGYVLIVESGRIDSAHHSGRAKQAILESLMLSKTVEETLERTNEEDTLIIVTADHSHVINFGGYHLKGTDPLANGIYMGDDLMPYTKVSYGNGPGHAIDENGRENLFGFDPTADSIYRQQAAVPLSSETHSADDVGIYAQGPMAHLITGVKEQHYIAHAAAYAACIGDNRGHCSEETREGTGAAQRNIASIIISIVPLAFGVISRFL